MSATPEMSETPASSPPGARPWATYAVIAANVAMFAVELACGASPIAPSSQQLLELGASWPSLTLNGEWWRLGSSMFLHFGVIHIALNMACLYQARVVEQLYGRVGFLTIYLIAGLGGGIASLIAGPDGVTAGASGAVFGVYGAFGAFLVLRRSQIEADSWKRTARSLGSFLVLNLVVGLSVKSISISAHLGGLLVGFGLGAALVPGIGAARPRSRRPLGLAVLGLALTAVAVMSLKAAPDVTPVLARFDAVDLAARTRWNQALTRAKAGELKDAELAEILERDVLSPYQKMRQDVVATSDIPERLRPMFAQLAAYTSARLAAWQAFDAVLRQPDPDQQKPLIEAYQQREAEADQRRAALDATLKP